MLGQKNLELYPHPGIIYLISLCFNLFPCKFLIKFFTEFYVTFHRKTICKM